MKRSWLWLSIPIALLGAVASGFGLFDGSTYERDLEHFAVQGRSQDVVTLGIAVPAVLVLGWLAARGSTQARLIWHGVVFYFAYTYAIAAFMVRFNSLFLVYTSLLACSILAVLGGLLTLDWSSIPEHLPDRWPRRPVAVMLGLVVATFTFLWLSDIVPALLDGTQPASLDEAGTPTNGVEVLDLSLLLPGTALVAWWVWRGESRGRVVATGLLAYVVLLGAALVAMILGLWLADLEADPAVSVVFVIVTLAATWLLALIVRAERDQPTQPATAGVTPDPA